MSDYFNVTTNVGDAAIATAIANNSKLNITHIAFGDGNGSVPTPTKTRTSLVREVHRQAVTKYAMHPTIANYIVIETIIPSNIGGFWIREIGIIADNVLISHGSHAPFFKVADPDGVSEYRLKFTQNVRDGNVVEISLDESLIYASQAWVNENYIPRSEIVDNLTTNDTKKPLSAAQGKVLQDKKLNRTSSVNEQFDLSRTDFDGIHTEYTWLNSPDSNIAAAQFFRYSRDWIGKIYFNISENRIYAQSFQWGTTTTEWKKIAYTDDNVASATKLATARTVQFSGAATGSFDYNGSANSSCILTLANSGVAASTYGSNLKIPVLTVNAKGLITGVSEQIIPDSSFSEKGVVQLVNDLTTGGTDKAITAEAVKLFYAKFASLQTDNGYLKIPTSDGNQIILQWCVGTTIPAGGSSVTTLPIAFTTACFFADAIGVGTSQGVSEIISKTNSTITFGSGNQVILTNPLVFAIGK